MSTDSALRPSKVWFWIGGALIALGVIGGSALGVNALRTLSETVDAFGRVRVPGGENCKLIFAKTGHYTIYYEYQSELPERGADCKDTGNSEQITASKQHPLGLDVTLVDSSGNAIPTKLSTSADAGFSMGKSVRAGVALREVEITTAGEYRLKVEGLSADAPPFVLAVGRGGVSSVLVPLLVAGAIGLGGFGLGLTTILVTASRRGRNRRMRVNQAAVATADFRVPTAYPTQGNVSTPSWQAQPTPPPSTPWQPQPTAPLLPTQPLPPIRPPMTSDWTTTAALGSPATDVPPPPPAAPPPPPPPPTLATPIAWPTPPSVPAEGSSQEAAPPPPPWGPPT